MPADVCDAAVCGRNGFRGRIDTAFVMADEDDDKGLLSVVEEAKGTLLALERLVADFILPYRS